MCECGTRRIFVTAANVMIEIVGKEMNYHRIIMLIQCAKIEKGYVAVVDRVRVDAGSTTSTDILLVTMTGARKLKQITVRIIT